MNEEIRKTIENYAECIRKVYEIGIPFSNSIDQTLEKLGGKLQIERISVWDDSELCLRNKLWESKFTIKVKPYEYIISREFYERQRYFEIAKQIGHLFMHTTYLDTIENDEKALLFTEDVSDPSKGIQANEFAYNLLMPRKEFIEEVRKNTENKMVKMKNVAEKFEVNYNIAEYRAKELELIQPTL